ncbi:hypothetical protein A3A20_01935 [Candidatus Wolfebacteria bacterium RIFCSPLOWO2_01_FULL_45_19]|uniref:Uncharacterized protein n=1 Tax=Candidatus Wolfebacteria bacterium RIFCSPLOWO2_01_FULL_45_19 TaxID=1802557 RepID=A0A1F8DV46_9BACT|nr:MAG: Alanine dehydrogenase [Parcubacteria group bacterium GW2011_GWB1_45_9]OGM91675.1 MAG: hypothetical protein A3A20_01935 [Candidatus Wolfebacteria bacterium RIFCSPLOWO2_01_FULL_45_19]
MIIGVPKELKAFEGRAGLDPLGVLALIRENRIVLVENSAGALAGFSDEEYIKAGANICSRKKLWESAELIVKVKEPLPEEYPFFRNGLTIMAFFHFSANSELKEKCASAGINAIPYEEIQTSNGEKPILKAMSVIAGEVAVDMAVQYLRTEYGRRGILMSDAVVTIIGALGNVGSRAHSLLKNRAKRIYILDNRGARPATPENIVEAISKSDIVIGAAVNKAGGAPHLITRDMVKRMRPGSVLIDVAIDEGGISETSRPTTYANPYYFDEGVIHVCVANLPGGVPRSATPRLVNESLPYIMGVASGINIL